MGYFFSTKFSWFLVPHSGSLGTMWTWAKYVVVGQLASGLLFTAQPYMLGCGDISSDCNWPRSYVSILLSALPLVYSDCL